MSDDPQADGKNIAKMMWGGSLAILGLLAAFVWIMQHVISTPTERGLFGDQFGAVNALFSGLAFLGLILTIAFQTRGLRLQSRDLRLQTEALRLQIKEFSEQKDEMKRSAKAQEDANRLAATELWLATRRMRTDVAIKSAECIVENDKKRDYLLEITDHIRKIEERIGENLKKIGLDSGNDTDTRGDHSEPQT